MTNKSYKNQQFFHCNFFSKNRKGQFFLIVTMIIVSLIVSITTSVNFIEKKSHSNFRYDANELKFESEKVMDYAIKNNHDVKIDLTTFTDDYALYSNADNLYFIFGDSSEITFNGYQKKLEDVSVNTGTGYIDISFSNEEATGNYPNPSSVKLKIDGVEYPFTLNTGQNFYFVISKEIDGDGFTETNG